MAAVAGGQLIVGDDELHLAEAGVRPGDQPAVQRRRQCLTMQNCNFDGSFTVTYRSASDQKPAILAALARDVIEDGHIRLRDAA